MYTTLPEVKAIAKIAFPEYNGKTFQVKTFNPPFSLKSYWSGGTKDFFVIVNMGIEKCINIFSAVPENGSPFVSAIGDLEYLPLNCAVVKHSIFCGKDMGITIYVGEDNITKLLPPAVELSRNEKIVLFATRSLISGYARIKDYRFHEANYRSGINQEDWQQAKQSLINKRLLNARGAITHEGRNAIEGVRDWPQ